MLGRAYRRTWRPRNTQAFGPGLLVTVGFIDPGNWASNMAAGSEFGYALLWVVTLSTLMLKVGCILVATVSLALLATNFYRHIERWSSASSRS
jgi:manganese transport protein